MANMLYLLDFQRVMTLKAAFHQSKSRLYQINPLSMILAANLDTELIANPMKS